MQSHCLESPSRTALSTWGSRVRVRAHSPVLTAGGENLVTWFSALPANSALQGTVWAKSFPARWMLAWLSGLSREAHLATEMGLLGTCPVKTVAGCASYSTWTRPSDVYSVLTLQLGFRHVGTWIIHLHLYIVINKYIYLYVWIRRVPLWEPPTHLNFKLDMIVGIRFGVWDKSKTTSSIRNMRPSCAPSGDVTDYSTVPPMPECTSLSLSWSLTLTDPQAWYVHSAACF